MSLPDDPFDRFTRLARLARRAPGRVEHEEMPPAIAARVLAGFHAEDRAVASRWERLSLRAVPFAVAVAAGCLFFSSRAPEVPETDEWGLAQRIVEAQLAP